MNPEIKARWIEALRGGKYQQTTGYLNTRRGFCCLGVLCDLKDPLAWEGEGIQKFGEGCDDFPPFEVRRWANLELTPAEHLAEMNDGGASFAEIADYIEQTL